MPTRTPYKPVSAEEIGTSLYGIQINIGYMQDDIKTIKEDIKAATYVTREQFVEHRKDEDDKYEATNQRVNSIYKYGSVVLAIVTAAAVGAFLKLILK